SVATFDSTRPGYTAERGREDAGGGPAPAPTAPGGQDKSADQQPTVAPRKDFRDTAFWNPVLETGADGTLTVPIQLPDNLTTWVAIARAITLDTRVGEGSAELLVAKDLSVDAALPREIGFFFAHRKGKNLLGTQGARTKTRAAVQCQNR
ncbi:MAG TPA: alpha-2-macroglobulin family protein, partial [Turneriella sp.]|nr:alpha-2-macroglobulin family protein [Turneriella sp.]